MQKQNLKPTKITNPQNHVFLDLVKNNFENKISTIKMVL